MPAEFRRPRRPAMLSPQRAEEILGDADPAQESLVAHTSAWALLGVGDDEFDAQAVERLRTVIREEGVDVVAHMWSRSPDFTLPGALWRLFLLSEWYRRDRTLVEHRYEEGARAPHVPGLEPPVRVPDLGVVMGAVDSLLRGDAREDDLADVLAAAARVMRILAAGETMGADWIVDPSDPLAHPVTVRARALVRTAEELDAATLRAEAGSLD